MAQYDTITKQVTDDITVTISKKKDGTAGDRLVAFLKWLSEKVVDPDYGVSGDRPAHPIAPGGKPPGGGGGRPDNSLPGDQPGIDNTLPGQRPPGGKPDQGDERPSNDLPTWIGANADKVAKLVLASCFDCKVPDQGLPPSAQPKK